MGYWYSELRIRTCHGRDS